MFLSLLGPLDFNSMSLRFLRALSMVSFLQWCINIWYDQIHLFHGSYGSFTGNTITGITCIFGQDCPSTSWEKPEWHRGPSCFPFALYIDGSFSGIVWIRITESDDFWRIGKVEKKMPNVKQKYAGDGIWIETQAESRVSVCFFSKRLLILYPNYLFDLTLTCAL